MLYSLGLILMAIGGVMFIPVPATLIFHETTLAPLFIIPGAIALTIGILLWRKFEEEKVSLGDAMVLVALAWILISLLGSIPFIFGNGMSFLNAWFESMSGFTATGLTVLQGQSGWIGGVPAQTIMFWRSLSQWIGGLGVIVLFLIVYPGTGKIARKLFKSEAREGRIMPSLKGTTGTILKIYLLFTALGAIGLFLAGMGPFAAINHSMTGIATGGYTTTPNSFAGYTIPIFGIALTIMIFGAISFRTHHKVISNGWHEFFKSIEVKVMLVLIGLATLALAWKVGLVDALFESTSALTGTGFSSTGLIPQTWGSFQKGILTVLMISGGGYGSTSSAIKLIRTIIILGTIYWLIKRAFLPERAVVPLKIGGNVYSEKDVMETATYAFLYFIVLIVGSLIVMLAMPGQGTANVLFESASAQGNVGLSTGITSIAPPIVKIVFIIQMIAGRLEILPVLAFLGFFIKKRPRRRKPV